MNLEHLHHEIELLTLGAIRTGISPEAVAHTLRQHADQIGSALPYIKALQDAHATNNGRDL